MKIAITGAAGFIGSALYQYLQGKSEVLGLVRENESDILPVTDYSVSHLTEMFQGVDCVIHLASKRGAGQSFVEYAENDVLLENILKAMAAVGVPKIVFMSSLAVYSEQNTLPWTEDQFPIPQTFYGLSKLTGENMCRYYARKGINYLIFRCAIVFGGNDLTRMMGSFIRTAANHETLEVRGKSVAKRDFIYVKEVVHALAWGALECQVENTVLNLSSGECHTNLEIAETVNQAFENAGNLVYHSDIDECLDDSYMASSAIKAAGYVHQYTLQSAMQDVADVMHSNH
ncbi:MAG: NAD(P)-dependent oxidoreductase [Ruminococcus flavefaciens]|jgi:nucleoside-diphosphate-sugar epimerase|nr:NAD(P)-dependent oxidoreductase [Ruminococcus flavefaciens]